jgi:hypothetical protein
MPTSLVPTQDHWLAWADYKQRYTALVFGGLQNALAVVEEGARESRFPDPDAANEEAGHILGLALVAAQNYMGEVEQIARDVRRTNPSLPKFKLIDLARKCGRIVPGTDVTDMEAVWHLANFWKHGDVWDPNWDVEARHNDSRPTIEALRKLGLDHDRYHRILLGIEKALQVDWWDCLKPLLARVSEWRLDALRACHCLVEGTTRDSKRLR